MDDHFSSFHFSMDEFFDVRSFARPRDTSSTRPPTPCLNLAPGSGLARVDPLPPTLTLGHTTLEYPYLPSLRASCSEALFPSSPDTALAAVAAARAPLIFRFAACDLFARDGRFHKRSEAQPVVLTRRDERLRPWMCPSTVICRKVLRPCSSESLSHGAWRSHLCASTVEKLFRDVSACWGFLGLVPHTHDAARDRVGSFSRSPSIGTGLSSPTCSPCLFSRHSQHVSWRTTCSY